MKLPPKILLLLLTALLSAGLHAQHNTYSIDDECYTYFQQAENNVANFSDGAFDEAMENLLATARRKQDTKAETIYYVVKLRRITNQGRLAPEQDRELWNRKVNDARREAQHIARTTGYMQYYYYAYELCQTYYYNTKQSSTAMNMLMGMMREARDNDDQYGLWTSLQYISKLYIRQSDDANAKPYLLEAVHIKETTSDATILRQNNARLYCTLAQTYPPGSDSCRINVAKAVGEIHTRGDSILVSYYQAQLAAWDGDKAAFDRCRSIIGTANMDSYVTGGGALLDCVQSLLEKAPMDTVKKQIDRLQAHHQTNYVAQLTKKLELWELATYAAQAHIDRLTMDHSNIGKERLDEISAAYGNNQLSASLAEASRKAARTAIIVAVLLTLLLLGILLFVLLHMRTLARANKRDEARIAELQAANEKVRMADEAKTRFVQNMSHEVRTPLNAIVGFSQLLSLPDGSFPEAEKEEFAHHIVNNTKMLTMLLDDILNASAMDSGGYRISYEDGEMNFIASESISSAEHRLQPGVRLYYVPAKEEAFHFHTDPRRVQQILINLLTNACKHTTQGEIRLEGSLTENPGFVTYSVTDTGSGVPADQAEAIFQRFTKLNEFVQGTGLGLSICREIATKMGGKVYLDTKHPGPGARFVLAVPLHPPVNNKKTN